VIQFEPTIQTPDETKRAASAARIAKRSSRPRRRKARSGNAPGNAPPGVSPGVSLGVSLGVYLGLGSQLGSARDRQRLRERNAAERVRVERMLAAAPTLNPISAATPASACSRTHAQTHAPSPTSLRAAFGRGCPVCASSKVVSDEVSCGGTMRLSECLHCDHRWTDRPRGRWTELGATMTRRDGSKGSPRINHANQRNRGSGRRVVQPMDAT